VHNDNVDNDGSIIDDIENDDNDGSVNDGGNHSTSSLFNTSISNNFTYVIDNYENYDSNNNFIFGTFIKKALKQHHHDNNDNNFNFTTLLSTLNDNDKNDDDNNNNNHHDRNNHRNEGNGNHHDKVMIKINKTLQNALRITYHEKCKLQNLLRNASLQLWYMRGQTVPYDDDYYHDNHHDNNNDSNEDKAIYDDKVMMKINKKLQNALRITYHEKCRLENLLRNASLQLWYMRGQTVPYENPYL
jgi:hypothetical protein